MHRHVEKPSRSSFSADLANWLCRSIGGPPQGFPPEELSRSDVGATSGSSSDVTQHHHQQQPHAHPGVQHNTGFASPQSSALGGYGGGHALYTLAAPGSQPPVGPYGQQGGVGADQYGMNAGMGPGYVVYYDGRMQQQMAPPPHLMRGPQQLYPHHQVPKVVILPRLCTCSPNPVARLSMVVLLALLML